MIKLQKQKMNIELEAASVIHSTAESSIFSVKKKIAKTKYEERLWNWTLWEECEDTKRFKEPYILI